MKTPDPKPDPSAGTSGEPVHIKKYGNRRLYSSSEARFVTLEEISNLVKSGRKIQVTDANSEADITAEILTQILLEGGRAQHFPVELLEQMIRVNEETLKGFWENYFSQSLNVFLGVQKEMEQLYKNFSQRTFQSLKNPFLSVWGKSESDAYRDAEQELEKSTQSRTEGEPKPEVKPKKPASTKGRKK